MKHPIRLPKIVTTCNKLAARSLQWILIFSMVFVIPSQSMADPLTREWIDENFDEAIEQGLSDSVERWAKNFIQEVLNGTLVYSDGSGPDFAEPGLGDKFIDGLRAIGFAKIVYDWGHGDHKAVFNGIMAQIVILNPITGTIYFLSNLAGMYKLAITMKQLEAIQVRTQENMSRLIAIAQGEKDGIRGRYIELKEQYKGILDVISPLSSQIAKDCSIEKSIVETDLGQLFSCWQMHSDIFHKLAALKPMILEMESLRIQLNSRFGFQLKSIADSINILTSHQAGYQLAIDGYHTALPRLIRSKISKVANGESLHVSPCRHELPFITQRVAYLSLRMSLHAEESEIWNQQLRELSKQYDIVQLSLSLCFALPPEQDAQLRQRFDLEDVARALEPVAKLLAMHQEVLDEESPIIELPNFEEGL